MFIRAIKRYVFWVTTDLSVKGEMTAKSKKRAVVKKIMKI
jgi:hypothetical protein